MKLTLLNKLSNPVSGVGYQCRKEKTITNTHLSLLGNEVVNSRTKNVELSASECSFMVATKKCHGQDMSCENSNCYFDEDVPIKFDYVRDLSFESVKCTFNVRVLSAVNIDKVMYDKNRHPCKASDLSCILHDSTFIWTNDIIHKCPYEKILPDLTFRQLSADSNLWTTNLFQQPIKTYTRVNPYQSVYHGLNLQTITAQAFVKIEPITKSSANSQPSTNNPTSSTTNPTTPLTRATTNTLPSIQTVAVKPRSTQTETTEPYPSYPEWFYNFRDFTYGLSYYKPWIESPPYHIREMIEYQNLRTRFFLHHPNRTKEKILPPLNKMKRQNSNTTPNQPSLLFKITGTVIQCNHTMYTTSEGIYLILTNNTLDLPISTQNVADIKTHFEILEAEFDALQEQMYENFEKQTKALCHTNKNLLQLLRLLEDHYFYYSDIIGQQIILYSNHGSLFTPTCLEINAIEILANSKYCYKDTPVTFTFQNQSYQAFLNSNGILKPTSTFESCNTSYQKVIFPSGRYIERQGNDIKLIDKILTDIEPLNLINIGISKPNFQHHESIIQDLNILQAVQNVFSISETNGAKFMVLPDSYQAYNPLAKTAVEAVQTVKAGADYVTRLTLLVTGSILAIVILMFIIFMCYKCNCITKLIFCFHVQREKRRLNNQANIELKDIVRKRLVDEDLNKLKTVEINPTSPSYSNDARLSLINNEANQHYPEFAVYPSLPRQKHYSLIEDSKHGINPERDFLISQNKTLGNKSLTNANEINQNSLPQSITNYFHKD